MKTCSKCGSSIFYVSGKCKACHSIAAKKWQESNKEKIKAKRAEYRLANKARDKEYNAAKYVKNLEAIKARNLAWAKANKDKSNAIGRAWASANKDKVKAKNAAWVVANPDRVKERAEKYRLANPERVKIATAAWHRASPESSRISEHNRRAQMNGGKLSRGLSDKLFKLQKGRCACCGQPLGKNFHLDHIMPLALGGSNTDDNIQLLRQRCNIQKKAAHPVDFMQKRGFLL